MWSYLRSQLVDELWLSRCSSCYYSSYKATFICFRWGVKLPDIVDKSIVILSTGGLGMAMFSLGMTIYHQQINYTPSWAVPVTRILIPSTHSTGLFMALRPSIISCGIRMAVVAMAMKFIVGPALMAVASFAVRLEGTVLKVAIVQVHKICFIWSIIRILGRWTVCFFVQAALPQGIVPFVFAKEYNVHPDTLSTG